MAEADIDAMAVLVDGSTGYGDEIRGAWRTLKTRVKPLESQVTQGLGADGVVDIDWSFGNHHKITSAGFDITGFTTSDNPTSGTIRTGTVEVHNTGGTDITVDATALGANGLASVLTIPAGKARLLFITETGTVET